MSDRRKFLAGAISSLALLWDPEKAPAALSGLTVLPGGGGGTPVPTLVWHLGSTTNDNNGNVAGNGYFYSGVNPTLAGNCLTIAITYPYSASRTVSLTDSTGDTWTAVGSPTTDSVNCAQQWWVCPNASPGLHTVTVTFNAAVRPYSVEFSEWANIATVSPADGSHGTANSPGATCSAGSYTPTTNNDANGGHLILTVARSNDLIGTLAANSASNITCSGSQQFLSADNTCTIPGACSYFVQTTNGAINPGFAFTQSTGTNFVCTSIALKAASAGTLPGNGIRIKRILHTTYVNTTSPATFMFPCDGNLRVVAMAASSGINNVTSVTDSASQNYGSNIGVAGSSQVFVKQNVTPSNTLKVSIAAGWAQEDSVRFYDVVNASPTSLDQVVSGSGANPGSGSTTTAINITPSVANTITICTTGYGTGPMLGLAAGSPAAGIYDTVNYTNMTDQDRMDNADGLAHSSNMTAAAQSWIFTMSVAARGSTAFWNVATFK